MYVADFETCDTDTYYKTTKKGEDIYNQRVWLAGYKNLETMKTTFFHNLTEFMESILGRGDNMNTEYGFHNLKYDGSYIVPWLNNHNYVFTIDKPRPKQYTCLVDDRNNWYTLTIQVTKRRKVTLWDTLKLFPAPLEYLPDLYKTPTKKIRESKEFYERKRPNGYIANKDELAYLENDLQVPAETIRKHIEIYGLRFKKTQASQAFANLEKTFPAWKMRFPPLNVELDKAIRKAYWGGISYVPKDKVGKDFYNISTLDINSSYPHKMGYYKMPYGPCTAQYGEGKPPDMSKFWVAGALVEFDLKKDCLPCIPKKAIIEGEIIEDKENNVEKWVDSSEGVAHITFSSIDYKTIQESYHFRVLRWLWSNHWAQKNHRELKRFVEENNTRKVKYSKMAKEVKDTNKEKYAEYMTIRNRAKIDNNASYGKFGEEIIKLGKTPHQDDIDGVIWKQDREDEQAENKRKFLPVAIAITAYGRQQLVQAANILGDKFLYCDTDSLHYIKKGGVERIKKAVKEGKMEIDPERLGTWKPEGDFVRGRYLRSKCYMEEDENGERHATVSGLPADPHTGQFSKKRSCLNWDSFKIGTVIPSSQTNKLRTVRTPTGNKLLPTGYEIKAKDTIFNY
jgi:hypothetical protein